MREKSIFKNVVLNIIRVSLSIIFPLITFPYVSRVLMADNLGKVNYALSIENYFALIAALGIGGYAVREGARLRHNNNEFQTFANEVFSVNIITTIVAYTLLLLLLLLPQFRDYKLLILLQSVSIVFTTIGVDWLNTVFEDYLYITVRSFVIQVILLIMMFVIVKKPEDYYKYAFLTVLSNGISCTLNFFYTRRKYYKIKFTRYCNFGKHIKSLLLFFANNLAISIYLNADTTMLGLYTNDYTVGIYAVAVKVYGVIKTIIAAMFTACIPRLSAYMGKGAEKEYKQLLNNVISVCTLFMFPAIAGLISLSKPIVLILAGEHFLEATYSLNIICVGIIGAIYGGIFTNCINLPLKREKYNLYATIWAAAINIALNFIFIPMFQERAAAATTVVAEFTVLLYCMITFKSFINYIDIKALVKNIGTALVEAVAILVLSRIIGDYISNWIVHMFALIFISIGVYIILLIITKNDVFQQLKK